MPGRLNTRSDGVHSANLLSAAAPVNMLKLMAVPRNVVFLPWTLFLYCLAAVAAVLSRFLVVAGAPPANYLNQAKVQELRSVIEHLHQREESNRRQIRELQEELELKDKDKKKAIKKLVKARHELTSSSLQPHADEVSQSQLEAPVAAAVRESRLAMHLSVGTAVISVWWFYQQDYPGLERKIISTILFPVGWMYLAALLSRRKPWTTTFLYCAAWFLTGFIACHKFQFLDGKR